MEFITSVRQDSHMLHSNKLQQGDLRGCRQSSWSAHLRNLHPSGSCLMFQVSWKQCGLLTSSTLGTSAWQGFGLAQLWPCWHSCNMAAASMTGLLPCLINTSNGASSTSAVPTSKSSQRTALPGKKQLCSHVEHGTKGSSQLS